MKRAIPFFVTSPRCSGGTERPVFVATCRSHLRFSLGNPRPRACNCVCRSADCQPLSLGLPEVRPQGAWRIAPHPNPLPVGAREQAAPCLYQDVSRRSLHSERHRACDTRERTCPAPLTPQFWGERCAAHRASPPGLEARGHFGRLISPISAICTTRPARERARMRVDAQPECSF